MAPTRRKQSREEKLEKKRLAERKRKQRIKSNPELAEQLRKRERDRYHQKKADGKILLLSQMPPRKRRAIQKRNKVNFQAYYERMKRKLAEKRKRGRGSTEVETTSANTPRSCNPPSSLRNDNHTEEILVDMLNSDDEIVENISPDPGDAANLDRKSRSKIRENTPRSSRRPRSKSLRANFVRRSSHIQAPQEDFVDVMNSDIENISQDNAANVARESRSRIRANTPLTSRRLRSQTMRKHFMGTSSPIQAPLRSRQMTPSISSIPASPSSLYPSSPQSDSSISSLAFDRLKTSFRKYRYQTSNKIGMLERKIELLNKRKDKDRKKIERLSNSNPGPSLKISNTEHMKKKKSPVKVIDKRVRSVVLRFYEDEEISQICPGKNDCITKGKLKKQKRYLKDTMKNLHKRYLEQGNPVVSYVTFTRLKPFWIVKPHIDARDTCMCITHANMELLISSLKRNKIIKENTVTEILESLCCSKNNINCLRKLCSTCKNTNLIYQEFCNDKEISYWKWEKISKTYNKNNVEKQCKIVEKVQHTEKPLDAIKQFKKSIGPFLKHCANIKNQYDTTKSIKTNLSKDECLVHIDFSENYGTKYSTEPQSVHWHKQQLTMHTAMIYYDDNAQAFCSISKSLRHDATAVWAHLVPILREIERTAPDIRTLHILSDSPSAQYRNKKIFYIISQLIHDCDQLNNVVWHYSECGHGKGAPDGVGGVLKRTADQLVAFGNDIVEAETLVEHLKRNVPGVKIEIVEEHEVTEKGWILPGRLKTFSGTMKVHQAVWSKETGDRVALRSLSCAESECKQSAVECNHGKHLGFYNLSEFNICTNEKESEAVIVEVPAQVPAEEPAEVSAEVPAELPAEVPAEVPAPSNPPKKQKKRNTALKPSTNLTVRVQRSKGSEKIFLRPKPSCVRNILKPKFDRDEGSSAALIDNYTLNETSDLDAIPSNSFFEGIEAEEFSLLEKTLENNDDNSKDENIFD